VNVATPQQILAVARVCHEANRAYCTTLGDNSQPAWDDAPDWQQMSALDGVAAISAGVVIRPSDSHESWSRSKLRDGWEYGPVKDPERKQHPCLVPFEELSIEQQMKDHIFFGIASAMLSLYVQ
jgi:RyR domain